MIENLLPVNAKSQTAQKVDWQKMMPVVRGVQKADEIGGGLTEGVFRDSLRFILQ